MKHSRLTDELQEKASLYAAGALPEGERKEFAQHLAEDDCAVCRNETREFESAIQLLALELPAQAPSASVKRRLMAQAEAAAARGAGPAQSEPRKNSAVQWLGWIVAVGTTAMLLVTVNSNSTLRTERESLAVQVNELRSQVENRDLTMASLTTPRNPVVDLKGMGDAKGRIFWDETSRIWRFYVDNLPPAGSANDYQLWFVPTEGSPVSATVFNTTPDGKASVEIPLPPDAIDLKAAAVTTEPAGGSPQPTNTDFVLLGSTE